MGKAGKKGAEEDEGVLPGGVPESYSGNHARAAAGTSLAAPSIAS